MNDEEKVLKYISSHDIKANTIEQIATTLVFSRSKVGSITRALVYGQKIKVTVVGNVKLFEVLK